jgi:hypothetical protein
MKKCPACGHNNAEGEFYCGDCGQILQREHAAILATRQIQGIAQELNAKSSWGTARLNRDTNIILHIRDVTTPIVLKPQAETTLGRADPDTGVLPDLDLTPYGGMEKGVSRMHAALLRDGDSLTLVDKGSSNGTYLNGQQVLPGRPRVLRDGDEIRLGRLVCHIYFK